MSKASEYLLAVYIAQQREPGPIAPVDIAAALDRSPAATTDMLHRLDDRGYLSHEPYNGATLTADGQAAAEELYTPYATLSQFFREVLDLAQPEHEAMRVAGTVSPDVVERLAATLLGDTDADATDTVPPLSSLRGEHP